VTVPFVPVVGLDLLLLLFPWLFSNALYARFCSVICMCACVCVVSVLAVSLQPYLLFVCLPWLLPFASRFFCFFFDPDHIFFLTKNQQTVKTLKGERAPQGGEKGTGRQLKPNCDSVFYLFTVCQQVYSPFQQLRATFLELCFSFLVATLD